MPLSPELKRLPRIAASFYRAGVLGEVLTGILTGETGRDMVDDARRLLKELEKQRRVDLWGEENLPQEGGVLYFNHPNMEVMLPAVLKMAITYFEQSGRQIRLVMGSEIPMTTRNFNEKTSLPGSVELIGRFQKLYSQNIIPVPTAGNRSDYLGGRTVAVRRVIRALTENDLVFISPEGHTEKEGRISPVETYHQGAGKMALLAGRINKPVVPTGIWEENKEVKVIIGQPINIESEDLELVPIEMMKAVADLIPNELRGPFRN